MTTITDTNVVNLDASALNAHQEAQTLISLANKWATGENIEWGERPWEEIEKQVTERRAKVAEMERSYLNALTHLMFVSQHHDGPLTISRDGEACFFWRHPRTGYHGGLIFHSSYEDGERLPVGTWSLHT